MALIPAREARAAVELEPEGAPGQLTEVSALSSVDLATAGALTALLFEPPFEAALRGAAASISAACAVPGSLLSEQRIHSELEMIPVEVRAQEVADEETLTAEEIRRSIEIAAAMPPARAGGTPRLFSASPVRGRDRVWADSVSSLGYSARDAVSSMQEFNRVLQDLRSLQLQILEPLTEQSDPQANERAEAFLQGLLTPGERRCLKRLKVVPVIGAETGDLWLVSRRGSYNLLRYERFGHLPKPVLYCVSAGQVAPPADLVSSLLLSLRGPEGGLLAKANRFNMSSSLNMYSLEPGRAESELYPDLWALAHARCEDDGLLGRTIQRAARMESLA